MQKHKTASELEFTGERMIPELNKGMEFFYEHLARYFFAAQFCKGKKVLDAGSGAGYGSFIVKKYGEAQSVLGVDLSKEAVDYSNNRYGDKTTTFNVDDVEKLATIKDNTVETVVSFELIEHITQQENFLKNVKRVQKDGEIFIVSTPNVFTYPHGNHFHVKELNPEEFHTLLRKYFKHVEFYYQSYELAQVIKKSLPTDIELEESFSKVNYEMLVAKSDENKSQYLLAVCSDEKLPDIKPYGVTTTKVDEFDLSVGLLSLNQQRQMLYKEMDGLRDAHSERALKVDELHTRLLKSLEENAMLINNYNSLKSRKFVRIYLKVSRSWIVQKPMKVIKKVVSKIFKDK